MIDRATLSLPDDLRGLIRALRPFGVWFGRRTGLSAQAPAPRSRVAAGTSLGRARKARTDSDAALGRPYLLRDRGCTLRFPRGLRLPRRRQARAALRHARTVGRRAGKRRREWGDRRFDDAERVSLLGCGNDELREILGTLGWRILEVADAGTGVRNVWRRAPARARPARREKEPKRKPTPTAPLSPIWRPASRGDDRPHPHRQVALACAVLQDAGAGAGRGAVGAGPAQRCPRREGRAPRSGLATC